MVSCCCSRGLVLHVQVGSSLDLMGSTGGINKKLCMCLRGLIIFLFCKIHDLVVHCDNLVQLRCPKTPEGDIFLNSPLPHCLHQENCSRQTKGIRGI